MDTQTSWLKKCIHCKDDKSIFDFSESRSKSLGRSTRICIQCLELISTKKNAHTKEYKKKNYAEIKIKNHNYRQRNRERFMYSDTRIRGALGVKISDNIPNEIIEARRLILKINKKLIERRLAG